MVSCRDNDVKDINQAENNANFDFDQIQVVSFETRASDEKWPDLKDQAVVSLRACMVDALYLEPIIGEEFEIKSALGEKDKTTNTTGCLSWDEEFDFNYLQEETFFEVKGSITGLDNFKGRRSYAVALNPWARRGVDLTFGRVDNKRSIQAASDQNLISNQTLETTRYNITVLDKQFNQTKTVLKLEVSTAPEILRRGLDGDIIKEQLNSGEFDVKYFLFARTQDTNIRTLLATQDKTLKIQQDGFLKSEVTFELLNGINPNAQIELGVQLNALSEHIVLSQDEGILNINKLDGTINGDLVNISIPFNLIGANSKIDDPNTNVNDQFGFVIDHVKIARGSESGNNLSSDHSHRDVDALLTLKMVDPLIHQDIKNHTFRVQLIDSETNKSLYNEKIVTRTGSGLINFRASIPYRRYNTRRWKEYLLRVSSDQAPYKNIVKERIVYVNPWLRTNDFGIDSADGTPPEAEQGNQPEIFIENFRYEFIGNKDNSFRINKNLDMRYEKRLRIKMTPKLKVDHDFAGDSKGYERIINGRYKLRLLILSAKDSKSVDYTEDIDLDKFYTLTAGEKEFNITNGRVEADIDLPLLFTDHMIFAMKNLALVELTSVESDTELLPGYFVGTIVAGQGRKAKKGLVGNIQDQQLRLTTGNVDIAKKLISKISTVKNKLDDLTTDTDFISEFTNGLQKLKPKTQVFNHSKFKLEQKTARTKIYRNGDNFKRYNRLASSQSAINSMIKKPSQTNQNLLNELCDLMYDKETKTEQMFYTGSGGYAGAGMMNPWTELTTKGMDYEKCTERPFDFIEFKQLDHVVSITEQPTEARVDSGDISSSTAMFISRGQNFVQANGIRESDYFQHGWSATAGVELSKFGFWGGLNYGAQGGYRRDLYTVKSDSEVLSSQARYMNQDGISFSYDRFDLDFKAEVKSCLLITAKKVEMELPERYVRTSILDLFRKKKVKTAIIASPNRFYVCLKNTREITRLESWYFIVGNMDSEVGDETLHKNAHVNVMRGRESFEGFRQNQLATDRKLIVVDTDDSSVKDQYFKYMDNRGSNISYKDRIGVGFPGLLE